MNRIELFDDYYQNYKKYGMPKAQLLIADIPYNVGIDAYGSNPAWYKDGDRTNGESDLDREQILTLSEPSLFAGAKTAERERTQRGMFSD